MAAAARADSRRKGSERLRHHPSQIADLHRRPSPTSDASRPVGPLDYYDSLSIEELARLQGVKPVKSVEDLARPGVFESDEELEEFIAYTYAARRSGMA